MKNKICVAVCVDEFGGMLFNGRRQSRDRVLISDLLDFAGDKKIIINDFSLSLFKDYLDRIILSPSPLNEAGENAVCFIENLPLADYKDKIETLVIYRWNREYPSDKKLDVSPEALGLKLISSSDFVGSSHKKITKEIYGK